MDDFASVIIWLVYMDEKERKYSECIVSGTSESVTMLFISNTNNLYAEED